MALMNALSLRGLLDYIDSNTLNIKLPHQNMDDAAAVLVESDFVYIPRFKTAGFSAAMIAKGFANGVELGGFALAKYSMSHPLATMASKGGADANGWGGVYAAMSLPLKCSWTYISHTEAKIACDAMNQEVANGMAVDDIATSTSTSDGTGGNTIIDTAFSTKLTGDNLEITRTEGAGTTTYYRRVKAVAYHTDTITFYPSLPYGLITALAGDNNDIKFIRKGSSTNYISIVYVNGGASGAISAARTGSGTVGDPYVITVTFFDDAKTATGVIAAIRADTNSNSVVHVENAPGNSGAGTVDTLGATALAQFNTISGDTYTVKKFTLWGPYEWATMKYLAAMQYAIKKMDYPKGNNNYGYDISNSNEFQYRGRLDPDYDDGVHTTTKVLTGTGPNSWYHNGKPTGVWGLNGNTWNWINMVMGSQGENHIIDSGYMGEGLKLPTSTNYLTGLATLGDCGVPDLALPGSVGSADLDFGSDYYYQDTGSRAALVGGDWAIGLKAGVFYLHVHGAPSNLSVYVGFRAVA
jgi:hypothetical protein